MINRRSVIKSGALAAGASGLPITAVSTVEADDAGFSLGQTRFVEVTIEHKVPENELLGSTDGLRRYSLDDQRNLLGLINHPAVEEFSGADTIVSTGTEFINSPGTIYGETTSTITVSTDYHRIGEKILYLSSQYKQPDIEIDSVDNQGTNLKINDRELSVLSGEEKSVTLSSAKVMVTEDDVKLGKESSEIDYRSIEITPKINIRDNGTVHVFGQEGYHILPTNSEDQFTDHFISARSDNKSSRIVSEQNADLFVVEQGGK